MRLLVIADDYPAGGGFPTDRADALVSCGDIPDQIILQMAEAASCNAILAVRGNHDSGAPFAEGITDLHLQTVTVAGIQFGGFRGSWRYKPRGHYLYDQAEVTRLLEAFPPADVFVTHNSPRHIHDREDEVHYGFEGFYDYIRPAHPRFLLHGHQHVNRETMVGETRVLGVYGRRMLEV